MTVKGTITDGSNGDPIPFASVVVKGMTIWTTSDAEGRYTIEAPATAVFTVSCLGYKEAEIAVNGRSALDIVLNPDLDVLNEAVVIGYGVQQKKLLTGSTVQVKGDELARLNTLPPLAPCRARARALPLPRTPAGPTLLPNIRTGNKHLG